jgi:hypothetical protein
MQEWETKAGNKKTNQAPASAVLRLGSASGSTWAERGQFPQPRPLSGRLTASGWDYEMLCSPKRR